VVRADEVLARTSIADVCAGAGHPLCVSRDEESVSAPGVAS
jgi:hypothetical protein